MKLIRPSSLRPMFRPLAITLYALAAIVMLELMRVRFFTIPFIFIPSRLVVLPLKSLNSCYDVDFFINSSLRCQLIILLFAAIFWVFLSMLSGFLYEKTLKREKTRWLLVLSPYLVLVIYTLMSIIPHILYG